VKDVPSPHSEHAMHEYFTLQHADQRREELARQHPARRWRLRVRRSRAARPVLRLAPPPPQVGRVGAGDRRVA
jgi:hypothetical protein